MGSLLDVLLSTTESEQAAEQPAAEEEGGEIQQDTEGEFHCSDNLRCIKTHSVRGLLRAADRPVTTVSCNFML